MKSLLRPSLYMGAALLTLGGGWICTSPPSAVAQTTISRMLRQLNPLLSHPPGYLGVSVSDVDANSAQKLGLKETHGAVVTLIDHDAPAGSALRLSDVILSVNGQNIDGADQFGRLLKEIPAGHKVTLVIFRDGAQQSLTIQLVDRKEMEAKAWNNLESEKAGQSRSGNGFLTGGGDVSGWHMPLFTPSLNVGVLIEPLAPQTAEILDVPSGMGVLVKQITRHSEAELAGLKAKDVILKVGNEAIKTSADWDREIRSNEGKSVQVTILRDRRQQILTLQVDSKHHRSQTVWTDIFPQNICPEMALLEPQPDPQQDSQFDFQTDQVFTQQQLDEMHKQMDQFRTQMEQFRQNFKPEDFRIDPKQMDEMRRQMEEFRKQFPQTFHFDRRQLDELQRELKNLDSLGLTQTV